MPRWRFEPVINLGNILTALGLLGALVGVWITVSNTLATQEVRIRAIELQLAAMQKLGEAVIQAQTQIGGIMKDLEESRKNSEMAVQQLIQIQVDVARISAMLPLEPGGPSGRH